MRYRTLSVLCFAIVAVSLLPSLVLADASTGEGTKFYLSYKAAFAKAKSIDDLLPFMSKERVAQVEKSPKEQRVKGFALMQMMDVKDVKITKETKTPTGFTLEAKGTGGMGDGPAKGTITIVREDGKLKIGEESWKN